MTKPVFTLRFHGVRGSLPASGADVLGFGGATMCIELRGAGGDVMIFDAGSGMIRAGKALCAEGVRRVDLFLSHWHYDHVLGLPFFAPLYDPAAEIGLWSGHAAVGPAQDLLAGLMRRPYFPVGPEKFRARIAYHDFTPPTMFELQPGLTMRTFRLNHPGGATAYRLDQAGRAVAIVTDTEHTPGIVDPALTDFLRGVDLLLYDSTYDDCDMTAHCGFGHSSWQQALRIAALAQVARVGFIHHAPLRSDKDLEEAEHRAQDQFPGAFFAREGGVLQI